jgi:DNA-binding NarL/FixJ family response regulator
MTSALRIQKFNQLMQRRIRSVLLVSTPYDAFVIQEEGNLTEQIFLEYKALSLSSAPHVTHCATEQQALDLLSRERFDLVLRVARLADTDLAEFGRRAKQVQPDLPVVVLGFDHAEMTRLRELVSREAVDKIYLWSGDAKILLVIIKELEDRLNADRDIAVADLRIILVVEDSIRYYSAFLSVLYPELMKQSQSLFAEGSNRLDRLLRMRTRPKVLHATHFEEATALYEKYRDNLLALVTDVGFPRGGQLDVEAGLALARRVRADIPDLPIVLQSAEERFAEPARALGLFVHKNSPSLLSEVRQFLTDYLGFGAFVFRLPSGEEVARAADVRELERCIACVPEESLRYHTSRNHVSNWLLARSEFDLAAKLRPQKVSDFGSIEEVRRYLIEELSRLRRSENAGTITDFSARAFDRESLFQRVGEGSLGGKARGLAFLNHLLTLNTDEGRLAGMRVCLPQTFVLTTDVFDGFLQENGIRPAHLDGRADEEILARFQEARIPDGARRGLEVMLEHLSGPLAVRSSSLLEDDMLHPLAGIYETVMIPNNDSDPAARLLDLERAVRRVLASTFMRNSRAYLSQVGSRPEEEKMAVVVQCLVGQRFGGRFYPHLSGVAQSYNYYPLPPLRSEDGVVQLALGLGRTVVEGGDCLRFCPRHPGMLPQFASPQQTLDHAQKSFFALDLGRSRVGAEVELKDAVMRYELEVALEDGTLPLLASRYDAENDVIRDGPFGDGPWVLTFANILKHNSVPLAPALVALLELSERGMGTPVELEFACDLGDLGRRVPPGAPRREPVLYALQLRPFLAREMVKELSDRPSATGRVVCQSRRALGYGRSRIGDVVYVKPEAFQPAHNPRICREVSQLNERLLAEKRPYVLIGPGRWGSSDPWLGIPVQWADISGARIIVEASPEGYNVDPSQGTHFFHNLTSMRLGYLTIPPGARAGRDEEFVDWEWLQDAPACAETEHLRWVRLAGGLIAELDGRHGSGRLSVPV